MIKILHLYSNILNLYGEYANTIVLKKYLEDQKITTELIRTDTLTNLNLDEVDFIYIGSGTELNQKLALADLCKFKDKITNFLDNGKFILSTGNSCEMFGHSIIDANGKVHNGLEIARFTTLEQAQKRIVSDVVAECDFISGKLIGFINKASETSESEKFFCKAIFCSNENKTPVKDGFRYKNLFGTHLIGPILIKNPDLLNYFVKLIGEYSESNFEFKIFDYAYQNSAYLVSHEKLSERL